MTANRAKLYQYKQTAETTDTIGANAQWVIDEAATYAKYLRSLTSSGSKGKGGKGKGTPRAKNKRKDADDDEFTPSGSKVARMAIGGRGN